MSGTSALVSLMIQHFSGEPEKINHMMKLYSFARIIAVEENVSDDAREVIEAAAVISDLCDNGLDSASFSDMLLLNLGCDRKFIERVHKLVQNSGNYEDISSSEQQILAEASFLVSAFEKRLDKETIVETLNDVFKTETGRQYLCNMFSVGNRRKSDIK